MQYINFRKYDQQIPTNCKCTTGLMVAKTWFLNKNMTYRHIIWDVANHTNNRQKIAQ